MFLMFPFLSKLVITFKFNVSQTESFVYEKAD